MAGRSVRLGHEDLALHEAVLERDHPRRASGVLLAHLEGVLVRHRAGVGQGDVAEPGSAGRLLDQELAERDALGVELEVALHHHVPEGRLEGRPDRRDLRSVPVLARRSGLEDHGVDRSVTPESFAVVVLALYQGLVRQRRTDPGRVSEDLFGQALAWQIAGMPKAADRASRK